VTDPRDRLGGSQRVMQAAPVAEYRLPIRGFPDTLRPTTCMGLVAGFVAEPTRCWGRSSEGRDIETCISCGTELHPERAEKYRYCTAPACQELNAEGLSIMAVGVNKSADQFLVLDKRTRQDLAQGRHHDPRRGSYGPQPTPEQARSNPGSPAAEPPVRHPDTPRTARPQPRRNLWSPSQARLALLYNQLGLRPDEIAQKLHLSRYTVTQIILDARKRRPV